MADMSPSCRAYLLTCVLPTNARGRRADTVRVCPCAAPIQGSGEMLALPGPSGSSGAGGGGGDDALEDLHRRECRGRVDRGDWAGT